MSDPQLEFGKYNWRGLDDLQATVGIGIIRVSLTTVTCVAPV